jgi:hypothetical protein
MSPPSSPRFAWQSTEKRDLAMDSNLERAHGGCACWGRACKT